MRLDQRISACLRTAASALLVVAMSASARGVFASEQDQGQTPPQQPAPQRAPGTQVPPTTVRVSPEEAVRMALQNNLGIRAEQLTPQIETFGVAQARAAWQKAKSQGFAVSYWQQDQDGRWQQKA